MDSETLGQAVRRLGVVLSEVLVVVMVFVAQLFLWTSITIGGLEWAVYAVVIGALVFPVIDLNSRLRGE